MSLINKFPLTDQCAGWEGLPGSPMNTCPYTGAKQFVATYDPNDEYILKIESNGGYKSEVKIKIQRPTLGWQF